MSFPSKQKFAGFDNPGFKDRYKFIQFKFKRLNQILWNGRKADNLMVGSTKVSSKFY